MGEQCSSLEAGRQGGQFGLATGTPALADITKRDLHKLVVKKSDSIQSNFLCCYGNCSIHRLVGKELLNFGRM